MNKDTNSISQERICTVDTAQLNMCNCSADNYVPYMEITGWQCKKCGAVKTKSSVSDCDCCPCKYEKQVYVTGYTTSGHTGEVTSIAILQNGEVHRFNKV